MFLPFRTIEDLLDKDSTWWESYIRRKMTLEINREAVQILLNMQNYYESFCRSGVNAHEPDFARSNDNRATQHDDDQNEEEIIGLPDEETDFETIETSSNIINQTINPFLQKLKTLNEDIFLLNNNQHSYTTLT